MGNSPIMTTIGTPNSGSYWKVVGLCHISYKFKMPTPREKLAAAHRWSLNLRCHFPFTHALQCVFGFRRDYLDHNNQGSSLKTHCNAVTNCVNRMWQLGLTLVCITKLGQLMFEKDKYHLFFNDVFLIDRELSSVN